MLSDPLPCLGIDAGGTATRWQLLRAGVVVAEGSVAPISGHLFNAAVRERSLAALSDLLTAVRQVGPVGAVCAGITGLAAGGEAAQTYAGHLAEGLGLASARVQVVDDMWIAYHAAFAPGQGILVYCGTGSVGYHVTAAGGIERAGGHGYILDDGGSAFWIARAGVRRMMRDVDEQGNAGWQTPLARHLTTRMGGAGWDRVRAAIYSGDRGSIAGLAPAVGEAAREGDQDALLILREAGQELARLALVLAGRVGSGPVVLTGGGFRMHPEIEESLRLHLPAVMPVAQATGSAVAAAARLAATL